MQVGKFSTNLLERLLDKLEIGDARVILGPTVGEDAALLDYGDLIVHMFAPESREFYDLESAWPNAKTLRIIQ